MSEDAKMWQTLQCLPDAVGHLINGDPDDPDSVKASDAVKWAIAEIARLREKRWSDAERRAIRWGSECLRENADLAEKKGMAQLSQHSLEASETLKRLLCRQPLPPGPYAKEPNRE